MATITADTRNIFQKGADWLYNNYGPNLPAFEVTNNPAPLAPIPTQSVPKQSTPAPIQSAPRQSAPAPTSSGGINKDNLSQYFSGYNGWNKDSAWADYQATNGQGKGGSSTGGSNLNGEIDAIYEPLNRTYDNYLNELEKQRPVAIEEANNASISAQNELDRSLGQYAQNRDSAKQSLQDQYSSAYSNAIREYNTLKQGAMNRFGGASSTGAAVSDLLGQETLRGTGGLRKTMMEGINQAFAYFDNANKFVNDKKFELQKAQATELKKINSLYDQKRAEIQARRFESESAKQAAKVDVLRQQLADSQALANQKYAAELELNMWREQVKTQLQSDLAKNAENVLTVPKINNVQFAGYDNQAPSQGFQVPTRTTYDSKSTLLSDSELQGNTFNELFDVFA